MRLLLAVAIAVIGICNVAAVCPDIDNCDSCTNYGVLCQDCPILTILSQDRTACLDCATGCAECTSDEDDVVTCLECLPTYYLKEGECNECPDGCQTCHENEEATVICDECLESGYVQDTNSDAGDCIACESNCQQCSLNEDLSTTCKVCYSYVGLAIRGYFLKTEDKSCKSCPSNCEKCTDDGEGTGLCNSCFDTDSKSYLPLVDEDDSTNDNTKCVLCPSECSACTGVEFSTGVATCTECVDGLGNYVDNGECVSCDDNCLTCDADGLCVDCDIGYRLDDSGACEECPAFCDACTPDETSGELLCDECEESYGVKEYDTCDVCTVSNCKTCSRASDGSMTCSVCKDGYGFGSDGKCASCPTGCLTCVWDTDHTKCQTCKTGYADDVDPIVGSSTSGDPSRCLPCGSNCATCDPDGSGDTDCTACDDSTTHYVDDSQTPESCEPLPANCASASSGACDTCEDGYYDNSGPCDPCKSGYNCATCDDDQDCDTCPDGYGMIDIEQDNTTESCEACGISNCKRCFAEGGFQGYPKKCWECNAGYAIYDDVTESALVGTACKKCPTGCETCTVDYSDNDKTTCSAGGCYAWDGKKAYTDGESGECVQCGSYCEQCTYDSSTEETTCDDGECTTGYAKNADGECEACPDECAACTYDSTLDAIACDDGQCDTGYGNAADGTCGECPGNCDDCSMTGETDDETLHCDTCKDGYVLNDDVCGACPSNCIACEDKEGTMTCTECDEHYALDSDKTCVKCATNCHECTATKCTECETGYGLAADALSCVDCATAAFENCIECGNIDASTEKAECELCGSGYTLEDMASNKSCADASSLSCGSGSYSDKPAECDVCAAGWELTEDYHCAKMCYQCGDVEAGVYVDQASCVIPASGSNSSSSDNAAELIECLNGICYGAYKDGQVMGGCLPSTMVTCTEEEFAGETCQTADEDERCQRCCDESECNTWLSELDGIPDSATAVAVNMMLLCLAALALNL